MIKRFGISSFHLGWLFGWTGLGVVFLIGRAPLLSLAALVAALCVPEDPEQPMPGKDRTP